MSRPNEAAASLIEADVMVTEVMAWAEVEAETESFLDVVPAVAPFVMSPSPPKS